MYRKKSFEGVSQKKRFENVSQKESVSQNKIESVSPTNMIGS